MKMTWSQKRVSFVLLIMKMSLLENILSSVHVEAPSIMPWNAETASTMRTAAY